MNDLYLYRRHLYVNGDTQSLCGNEARLEDAEGVAVGVGHLGGMKLLCDDCKHRAEQYQHLRETPTESSATLIKSAKIITAIIILTIIIITAAVYVGI